MVSNRTLPALGNNFSPWVWPKVTPKVTDVARFNYLAGTHCCPKQMLMLNMFLGEKGKKIMAKNCSWVLKNSRNEAFEIKSSENQEIKERWVQKGRGQNVWDQRQGSGRGERGRNQQSSRSVGCGVVCASTTITHDRLEIPNPCSGNPRCFLPRWDILCCADCFGAEVNPEQNEQSERCRSLRHGGVICKWIRVGIVYQKRLLSEMGCLLNSLKWITESQSWDWESWNLGSSLKSSISSSACKLIKYLVLRFWILKSNYLYQWHSKFQDLQNHFLRKWRITHTG